MWTPSGEISGPWTPTPKPTKSWTNSAEFSSTWSQSEYDPEVFGWGTSGYGDRYGDPHIAGVDYIWTGSPELTNIWT